MFFPVANAPITLTSPLPPGQLHVRSMTGQEELGRLFEYEIELLTKTPRVAAEALLGKPMTVSVAKHLGKRLFNGIVTRITRLGTYEGITVLRVLLAPRLWLLTRTRDCRIFQHMTVPEVVAQVLGDHGIDFVKRLETAPYRKWEYLTQYRESDFAFISRLMEQEGIYYYFKHSAEKHDLVLADSMATSHDPVTGYERMTVHAPSPMPLERDHLTSFRERSAIASAKVTLQDHDFRMRRGSDIRAVRGVSEEHDGDGFEVYDYPGEYTLDENKKDADVRGTREGGERYAQVRLEELRGERERCEGEGNARGLEVGAVFAVDIPEVATKKFLILSTHHEYRNPDPASGGAEGEVCHVTFAALNLERQFRPNRTTERPIIAGPQTGTVVGKEGEELWTDEYGRVKVQLHWDRLGQWNEDSSVFMRVAQVWAGSNWGAIHIPRIGQEVVVQFLEGDPDRPLVVGSLYNIDNPPPYTLPENATQSGIKTRSTKGGTPQNFNEIRFEDKKGQEELHIQAEKDMTTLVKNDQSTSVQANRSVSTGGNESYSVTGTRTLTVTKKDTETFEDAREVSVAQADTHTIDGKRTESYNGGRERTVKSFDNTTVEGANKNTTVHGQYNVTADEHYKVAQGGNQIYVKDKVFVESVGEIKLQNQQCEVDLKDGKLTITAASEITLNCGPTSITLKSDGTISITGPQKVTVAGGSGGVELAPTGATVSGQKATVSGTMMTEITGGIVKVN
jgi:type VI secretion system secreted protein VgrG